MPYLMCLLPEYNLVYNLQRSNFRDSIDDYIQIIYSSTTEIALVS